MKMISSFPERLAEATQNMSHTQIADLLGISKPSISSYFCGRRKPSRLALASIAHILNVSPAWLLGYDVPRDPTPELYVPKLKKVPILGKTACGTPVYYTDFEDNYAMINEEMDVDFALQAKGDSMIGIGINDGDVVFFRKQDIVENGQLAAVFVDDETTLKRVYYYREEQKILLCSENPKYPPLVYTGEELNHVHIIGVVVAHIRKL